MSFTIRFILRNNLNYDNNYSTYEAKPQQILGEILAQQLKQKITSEEFIVNRNPFQNINLDLNQSLYQQNIISNTDLYVSAKEMQFQIINKIKNSNLTFSASKNQTLEQLCKQFLQIDQLQKNTILSIHYPNGKLLSDNKNFDLRQISFGMSYQIIIKNNEQMNQIKEPEIGKLTIVNATNRLSILDTDKVMNQSQIIVQSSFILDKFWIIIMDADTIIYMLNDEFELKGIIKRNQQKKRVQKQQNQNEASIKEINGIKFWKITNGFKIKWKDQSESQFQVFF